MRAGAFTEIVTIMRHRVEQTESGEQRESWVVGPRTRAALIHNSGTRLYTNNELFYEYTKTFVIHHYIHLCELDRICYKNRFYRILSIDEDRHMNQKTIITELVNE